MDYIIRASIHVLVLKPQDMNLGLNLAGRVHKYGKHSEGGYCRAHHQLALILWTMCVCVGGGGGAASE